MPCMYFTKLVLGRSGSGLRRYKYSAICFNTPIKTAYKDTVGSSENLRELSMEPGCDARYPAC